MATCLGTNAVVVTRVHCIRQFKCHIIFQATTLHVVPPVMVMFAKHPKVAEYDLSSVKTIICGAAPLSSEIEEAVKRKLGLSYIQQGRSINLGIKHGFSCINIRQVPWAVLKTEAEGRGFQHLPRDLSNVYALKNHVRSLLLHKNWKDLLHFALFLALFRFAFSQMSRERNFHGLCSFQGRAVHIS